MMRLIFTAILFIPLSVRAESQADWNRYFQDCLNFRMPYVQLNAPVLKDLFTQGAAWEKSAQIEIAALTNLTEVTCKKWSENPNGDEPLREFREKFSTISSSALNLKQEADTDLVPSINGWVKSQSIDTAIMGFRFEDFQCGKAFLGARKRINENVQLIEARFQLLKKKCPVAADAEIAKALASGNLPVKLGAGNGGPGRIPSGHQKKPESDITGTKPVNGGKP